jgi:hypothetical protein
VSNDIISYIEMCRREGASLQQGMNFGLSGDHSVILMSLRQNAPYRDRIEGAGTTLIYEGPYNGVFHLTDSWQERDEHRVVFKFRLVAVEGEEDFAQPARLDAQRRRLIPTVVKLEVWKRDGGRCAICGATDELHFDHIVPFSKGGTSITAANVQLLCARHNLAKHDRIE